MYSSVSYLKGYNHIRLTDICCIVSLIDRYVDLLLPPFWHLPEVICRFSVLVPLCFALG
jgi:hypothetical protein